MVAKNKTQLLEKVRQILEVSEPFIGSDESWIALYGIEWEYKKREYLDLCKIKADKLREKYLLF